ncbi:hypothetical protein SMACR_08207 [Sordaria macrospora]|uniref:WGS project CABT00000000 data, contig 2.43 n=2 Tax=Sordaria macrospora TaxID=5147 RepID=F7W859_SORMK|nr:uncharacterized protein SMAC_08207 [Sordaria macrospora k-hell]KAA8624132.1 hypothetical protein SMACR_08207 [Sordaria macrospora]WPJ61110.1 hypothetical protein SMAC4_08207 [Sordaria macrospora]CCC13704.1 unnamed protein product [Sordaria macrospora k-hell]
MAIDNTLYSEDDGGSRRTSLSTTRNRYLPLYRQENDDHGHHRSNSIRSVNYGNGTSTRWNGSRQAGSGESNLNWRERSRAPDLDPSNIAGQIMVLPPMPKLDLLKVGGSDGRRLDDDGYEHPVLILTNPDHEGYMTSFKCTTLAKKFPGDRDKPNKYTGSYMQIADDQPPDPDAPIVLHLYNEHNTWPKYMRKRSFVETIKSYRCRRSILEPYEDSRNPWFIDADSLDIAIARVLFMKVEFPLRSNNLLEPQKPQHMVVPFGTDRHPGNVVQMLPRKPHFGKKPLQLAQPAQPAQPAQAADIKQPDSPQPSAETPRPAPSNNIREAIFKKLHMDSLSQKVKTIEDMESSFPKHRALEPKPSRMMQNFLRSVRRTATPWSDAH